MSKTILSITIVLVVAVIGILGVVFLTQQPKTAVQNTGTTSTPTATLTASTTGTSSNAKNYNVTIQNYGFSPATINVKVGDTVTWTNNDPMQHTISGDSLQSSPLSTGQTYSFTFTSAGTFNYICSIHTYMNGKVIVE